MRSRELYDCQSGAANGFWAYDVEVARDRLTQLHAEIVRMDAAANA